MEDNNYTRKSWFSRPVEWIVSGAELKTNGALNREIAAWSEVMGRMSAELWASDRQGQQAGH